MVPLMLTIALVVIAGILCYYIGGLLSEKQQFLQELKDAVEQAQIQEKLHETENDVSVSVSDAVSRMRAKNTDPS
jgi:tRNA A22 N-methylase